MAPFEHWLHLRIFHTAEKLFDSFVYLVSAYSWLEWAHLELCLLYLRRHYRKRISHAMWGEGFFFFFFVLGWPPSFHRRRRKRIPTLLCVIKERSLGQHWWRRHIFFLISQKAQGCPGCFEFSVDCFSHIFTGMAEQTLCCVSTINTFETCLFTFYQEDWWHSLIRTLSTFLLNRWIQLMLLIFHNTYQRLTMLKNTY